MHSHKKLITAAVCLLTIIACGTLEGWHTMTMFSVAAQGVDAGGGDFYSGTIRMAVILATAMEMFAFLIFHFLQWFLDPLFILALNEAEGLRDIWKYSRDIVNVIFAFMLIFAGIYTVVTGQKELVQSKFKQFILAVILVNFSWFFPRVILDVANVLTATIYQLPAGLATSGTIECKDHKGQPCRVITDVKYFDGCFDKDKNLIKNAANEPYIHKGIVCYDTEVWNNQTNTAFGILNGLVINYAQLPNLTRVLNPGTPAPGTTPADRLQETLMFLMHILFILVLMAMLFLPLVAMFVVFLIRIPIMWFTIAFMPFMFIGFVMGDKMGQFDTMKIFSHYVKAAFLPTVVAVPFTVGFMILTEFMGIKCTDIGMLELADFCEESGSLLMNISNMWQLLIMLMAFVVIWMGFWAALQIDDIYVNATSGIKNFGESVGKTALKLPFSIPFIPTGGGNLVSPLALDDMARSFSGGLGRGESVPGALKSALAGTGKENSKKVTDAINKSDSQTAKKLNELIATMEREKQSGNFDQSKIDSRLGGVLNLTEVRNEVGDNATLNDLKQGIKANSALSSRLEALRNP